MPARTLAAVAVFGALAWVLIILAIVAACDVIGGTL